MIARGSSLIIVVVVLSLLVMPQAAASPGQTYHFSSAGQGADGGWTTCPTSPLAGQVCTDTWISVSEYVYKEDGTQFPSTTIFLGQFSYKFDRKGNYVPVSETSGYGEATLAVGRQLKNASAGGTVALTTCTIDRKGMYVCTEGGTATVDASWTGVGSLVRSSGNYRTISKGSTYTYRFQGAYRDAVGSAQVDGVDLGASLYGSISDSKSKEVWVSRGGH
jgi:hypothetical protein